MNEDEIKENTKEELERTWDVPKGLIGWFKVVNQTSIGIRYILTAFTFFLMAGVLGILIRMQLSQPESTFLSPELYNQIFTVHGITMMFLFAIPVLEGIAVYLVPLMIGTRDLCFPRLSAFSYFVYLIGGIFLWGSFFMGLGPDAGWFNYVPLASKQYSEGIPIDIYVTVITFIEVSALATALELIATILKLRTPGLSLAKMPPFVWSILVMAFMVVFAMPGVIVGSILLALDRLVDTAFFLPLKGGEPILWQHLFWWFGHPDVYIAFIPATGIVSTIIPVFSGVKLVWKKGVICSIVLIGVVSFGLWVHHMFAAGIPLHASSFFSSASALIAIPGSVQFLAWIATIWKGKIQYTTPMYFCLGFIFTFLVGGLTGVMIAIVPFDLQVHDSYFIVAHLHYVLIGGVLFPLTAALFYWWPKFTGKLLNEKLGKLSFWFILIGFNITFFPMHELGFLGMPRRVYTYLEGLGWSDLNYLSSIGAYIIGIGYFIVLINTIKSMCSNKKCVNNPWAADTLEWKTSSPPPSCNFYYFPQILSDEEHASSSQVAVSGVRSDAREVITTSVEEAKLQAVIRLPGPSIWPFFTALATCLTFVGSIWSPILFVIGFFLTFICAVNWLWVPKPWDKGGRFE